MSYNAKSIWSFHFCNKLNLENHFRYFLKIYKSRNINLSPSSDCQFKKNKLTLGCFRKAWTGVPVYLAPWTACPPGGKPTAVSLTPGGQAVPGYLTPRPGYLHPRGASCPGRFILPPAHKEKILLCDVYYYLQHFNNYMQFLSYKYVNLRWLLQTFSWVSYWQGVGGKLSRAVYLAPRPEFQIEWIISKFYYTVFYRNI